jgi:hypothetical protein
MLRSPTKINFSWEIFGYDDQASAVSSVKSQLISEMSRKGRYIDVFVGGYSVKHSSPKTIVT